MKKPLTATWNAGKRGVNNVREVGRNLSQAAGEVYRSQGLRGLGITTLAQIASSELVTRLYDGDPESKDVLQADAVFVAPVSFFTGRGMRRVFEWARVPEHRARQIILWANPILGVTTEKFAGNLMTNAGEVSVSSPADVLDYIGAAAAETVNRLPEVYFNEGSVVIPTAIAGSIGAVNGMQKPAPRPR